MSRKKYDDERIVTMNYIHFLGGYFPYRFATQKQKTKQNEIKTPQK